MRIKSIKLKNFRIYKGDNEIVFNNKDNANISLIAGKNGFGKTTFLTSLIWAFYGGLMSQVEDKYRKEIKSSGGYDTYRRAMFNKTVREAVDKGDTKDSLMQVEVRLLDVLIPSIPCKEIIIQRSFNLKTNKESLRILIDGEENKLTKEVGYDVFINDFILPREIAKFFFFDAEKIVSLAEAKSAEELRTLSKAYAEVLGIKKYEDLKYSLKTLLSKLRRSGASKIERDKLDELTKTDNDLREKIEFLNRKVIEIDEDTSRLMSRIDRIQEKLIREGSELTLDELKKLRQEKEDLIIEHKSAKNELKKVLDIVPIVIAGTKLKELIEQVKLENSIKDNSINKELLLAELNSFSDLIKSELRNINLDSSINSKIEQLINNVLENKKDIESGNNIDNNQIILDVNDEISRKIIATYNYIKESFSSNFKSIIKKEKEIRTSLNVVSNKIRQGEARKNNPLAQKLREERAEIDTKLEELKANRDKVLAEKAITNQEMMSNAKILSEYEKNFNLLETDKKKYDTTVILLEKMEILTSRIKEEKKYSLQKSVLIGLNKLMHKSNFIYDVNVKIDGDIMDIDLLDKNGNVIDKDSLSKGEQQLYATALLKALVDESGINFPVFIDSPLQKFDKEHSSNIIEQFYPTISEQVVLFPLLEKELSINEYNRIKPKLSGVYLIENTHEGSTIKQHKLDNLFTEFNKQNNDIAYQN